MMRAGRWPPWLLVLAGLLMAGLWLAFTFAHGPTSYNEGRQVLGLDMHRWGLLLGFVPNVLIGVALILLRRDLLAHGGRLAAVGLWLTVAALLGSAALDAAFLALAPPLLLPVSGLGLMLLAVGLHGRRNAELRVLFALAGSLHLVASVLSYVPGELADTFNGYRVYGLLAHGIAGLAWVALGLGLTGESSMPRPGLAPAAPR